MGAWSNTVTITVGGGAPSQPAQTQQPQQGKKPSLGAIIALGVIAALFASMSKKG